MIWAVHTYQHARACANVTRFIGVDVSRHRTYESRLLLTVVTTKTKTGRVFFRARRTGLAVRPGTAPRRARFRAGGTPRRVHPRFHRGCLRARKRSREGRASVASRTTRFYKRRTFVKGVCFFRFRFSIFFGCCSPNSCPAIGVLAVLVRGLVVVPHSRAAK